MATTKEFDPLEYIESAFLDTENRPEKSKNGKVKKSEKEASGKFRKTQLSAPRPRKKKKATAEPILDAEMTDLLETLPKNIEFLGKFFSDGVTSKYYQGEFKESREELIRRLLDPELTLEETSRLLGVCPATVRRYTNRGWLHHHRTKGGQRRFRLSGVVKFVDEHGRLPEE